MTSPVVAVPQLDPEQAARIRSALEQLGRQLAQAVAAWWRQVAAVLARRWEIVQAAARGLAGLIRALGVAVCRALPALVRLADQRRERLRVMRLAYRRRLRQRRRRAR
ncbi:hypothetical protein [Micromonospora sp. WMMD1082]|uniref:hypothetical protein n=1 Tax=Micromonospora sp. WMMD1082 TaxID=3016104 RepID=UPI002417003F|nr:hypothetical protein [Micromonospora sp. WMMD1082]MDG4796981.1 hypothetical protein [Micromonospora sp. WMMD1082]